MSLIFALGCLLLGTVAGALLYKHYKSDEARVQDLETRLRQLTDEYDSYKREVHGHFSDSAHLLAKLTESYRDVHQHMAHGARNLCPDYIANQVNQIPAAPLTLDSDSTRGIGLASNDTARVTPPLDYVAAVSDTRAAGSNAAGNTGVT